MILGLVMGYVYYNDPVGVGRAVEQFTRAATDLTRLPHCSPCGRRCSPRELGRHDCNLRRHGFGSVWPRARWLVPTSAKIISRRPRAQTGRHGAEASRDGALPPAGGLAQPPATLA